MNAIEIYTRSWCAYCKRAKSLLDKKGLQYKEMDVESDPAHESEMIKRSGRTSVPQVFISGTHVGGSDDLMAAWQSGLLDSLIADHAAATA